MAATSPRLYTSKQGLISKSAKSAPKATGVIGYPPQSRTSLLPQLEKYLIKIRRDRKRREAMDSVDKLAKRVAATV